MQKEWSGSNTQSFTKAFVEELRTGFKNISKKSYCRLHIGSSYDIVNNDLNIILEVIRLGN